MAIASGVISGAGQIYGGLQANAQGKYEAKLAKRNAAMEVEAEHENRQLTEDSARDYWKSVARTKGQNIAAMAANGIDVDFGSADRLQQDTVTQSREEVTRIYRQGEKTSKDRLINASNYVSEAKAARARGKAALIGSAFGAAGSIMGGLSQASSIRAKIGTGN